MNATRGPTHLRHMPRLVQHDAMQAQLERHRGRMAKPHVRRTLVAVARLAQAEQDQTLYRLQARFRRGNLVKVVARCGGGRGRAGCRRGMSDEDGVLGLIE